MIPLQKFDIGDPETVRKLNALVEAVNQLNVMTGDGIIKVLRTPTGIVFKIDKDAISSIGAKGAAAGGGEGVEIHAVFPVANADSGDTTNISCYVDTDGVGDPVSENVEIEGGGHLGEAIPLLTDGTRFYAEKKDSSYYSTTVFHATEDCVCEGT